MYIKINELIWEEMVGQRSGDECESSRSPLWSSEVSFILSNTPLELPCCRIQEIKHLHQFMIVTGDASPKLFSGNVTLKSRIQTSRFWF